MAGSVSTIWLKSCYLAVNGMVLPIRQFNVNFSIGMIPTCSVVPVTGMSQHGSPQNITSKMTNGMRAVLYLSVNDKAYVIFAGYVLTVAVGTDSGGYRSNLAYQVIVTLSHNAGALAAYGFGQRNFLPFGVWRDNFLKEEDNIGINIEKVVETEGLKENLPAVHCKQLVEKIMTWYQQGGSGYPNATGIIRASNVKFKDIIQSSGIANGALKSGITLQSRTILSSSFGGSTTAFDLLKALASSCLLTLVPSTYYLNVVPSLPMQAWERGKSPTITAKYIINASWTSSFDLIPTTCVWVPRRSVNRNTVYKNANAPYNPLTHDMFFNQASYFRYPNQDTGSSLILNPPQIFNYLLDLELVSSGGKTVKGNRNYSGGFVDVNTARVKPKNKVSQAPNDSNTIGSKCAQMLYGLHAYAQSQVTLVVDPAFNFSGAAGGQALFGRSWAEQTVIGLLGRTIAFVMPTGVDNDVENGWFVGYVNSISIELNRDNSQFLYRLLLTSVRPYITDYHALKVSDNPLFDNVNAELNTTG